MLKTLNALPEASVNILTVADASVILGLSNLHKAITVTYLYSVVIEAAGFSIGQDAVQYITRDLMDSTSSGEFTRLLQEEAVRYGSPGLAGATTAPDGLNIHPDYLVVNGSPKPTIQPTFRFGDANEKENNLEIIGPALALVLLIIVSVIVYFRYIRHSLEGDNFVSISQDAEGYDELELMEKKAQMVALSQRGTNPLHRLRQNRKNNVGYININADDDSHHVSSHTTEENGNFLSARNTLEEEEDVNY